MELSRNLFDGNLGHGVALRQSGKIVYAEHEGRHALAALCLHGQPFGFTREDVKLCRLVIPWIYQRWDESVRPEMDALESLASRIEALLPPEA
jgi:hypothetical protein